MAVSQPTRNQRLCRIDGCEKPAKGRGWCAMHWWRWRHHGDPHYTRPKSQKPRRKCAVNGCEKPFHANGYCNSHDYRNKRYGSPHLDGPGRGSGRRRIALPGYDTLHRRLSRDLGPARTHSCVECGKQAAEWSYNGGCPNELVDKSKPTPLSYSLDPDRYSPRCVKCHRRMDMSNVRERDELGQRESSPA